MPASTIETILKVLKERDIDFLGEHVIERIVAADFRDDNNKHSNDATGSANKVVLHYPNGKELKADLVWGTHPLRVPQFVRDALPDDICLKMAASTSKICRTVFLPNVYVIGDC